MKTLKELCRRPVLDAYKTTLADMVVKYNMDEDLEDFLCFGDLEEVCEQYASEDIATSPHAVKSNESAFSKLTKLRQTFSGIGSKKTHSPTQKTTLPQASWDTGDLKKKKLSVSKYAIVKPQPGRQSVSNPTTPTMPLRRTGSYTNTSSKPAKLRGRYNNMNPNDMLLGGDPRPMSPEQLSEASSTTSSRTSSDKKSPLQSLLFPSNGVDSVSETPKEVPNSRQSRSTRPQSASTYKSGTKQAVVRPRSASATRDENMDSLLYGSGAGLGGSAHSTPKARKKYGPKSSSRDNVSNEVFSYDDFDAPSDIWSTPKEGAKMNLQEIEQEMLSNLNLSTMTQELTNMTNSYSDPDPNRSLSHYGRQNGSTRPNGVAPRTRGYSSSSTESGASSNRQYKSATLPRNHTPFQRSYQGSDQGSNPSTPRSSKKKYDNVPSSGYGRTSKKSVQSSGYGQPCKVHDTRSLDSRPQNSPGRHRRTLSSNSQVQSSGYGQVQSSGYGQTRNPQKHQRTLSATSSGYGTRSTAGSAPEYTSRSPVNLSNFAQMRNNVGYRSLRIPSKTSQMYDNEYGGSPDSYNSTHQHNRSFDQMSNNSDAFSDSGSADMKAQSKIPVYHGKPAPSPIKPPPDSKLPVIKVSSPDKPPEKTSPFQRSKSLRKW